MDVDERRNLNAAAWGVVLGPVVVPVGHRVRVPARHEFIFACRRGRRAQCRKLAAGTSLSVGDGSRAGRYYDSMGRAEIVAKTYDPPHLPALPLRVPFTVPLHGHGECAGAIYAADRGKRNTASGFIAKSLP